MDDGERAAAREHLQAIATRTPAEDEALRGRLLRASWPGGPADATRPMAREWVRRWRPVRGTPLPSACTCPTGRCGACN